MAGDQIKNCRVEWSIEELMVKGGYKLLHLGYLLLIRFKHCPLDKECSLADPAPPVTVFLTPILID